MPIQVHKFTTRRSALIAAGVVLLVALSGLIVVASARLLSADSEPVPVAASAKDISDVTEVAAYSPPEPVGVSTAIPHQADRRGGLQVVRFTLYDAGIYPQEARVAPGRVVIAMVDYTGGSAGLVVEREIGQVRERAGLVARSGARWRGRQELNLSSGIYRVYDASNAANRATLIVQP